MAGSPLPWQPVDLLSYQAQPGAGPRGRLHERGQKPGSALAEQGLAAPAAAMAVSGQGPPCSLGLLPGPEPRAYGLQEGQEGAVDAKLPSPAFPFQQMLYLQDVRSCHSVVTYLKLSCLSSVSPPHCLLLPQGSRAPSPALLSPPRVLQMSALQLLAGVEPLRAPLPTLA